MRRRSAAIHCLICMVILFSSFGIDPVHAQAGQPGLRDAFGQNIGLDRSASSSSARIPVFPAPSGVSPASVSPDASNPLFKPYVTYGGVGTYPQAVAIGDFNNDGLNDVALTTEIDSGLYILFQNASGGLDAPVRYSTGDRPETMASGDLNHDGRADLVIASVTENALYVYLQTPDGGLAQPVIYPTGYGPDAVVVADLNQDGRDDVAVSHWNAPYLGVYLQKADGTLAARVDYPAPMAGFDDIDVGDFNHDGRMDVVKMSGQGNSNPNLAVYTQTASGTLNPPIYFKLPQTNSNGVAAGDINGDGLDDLALSYGFNSPTGKLAVFGLNANNTLSAKATYSAYDNPGAVEIADLDRDGRKDVVVLHNGWMAVGVYLQQSDGTLAGESLYSIPYATWYKPQGLDVGDINNDGYADIVIADSNNGLVVLYSRDADFTLSAKPPVLVAKPGDFIQTAIHVDPFRAFGGDVLLALDPLPAGISYAISQTIVSTPGSADLYLYLDPGIAPGSYIINLSGTSGDKKHVLRISLVIGLPVLDLTASNDSPTQLGGDTAFSASVSSGSNVVYRWDFGDGAYAYGANTAHRYLSVGTYQATVTASNELGWQQASTMVVVEDVPITGLLFVVPSSTPIFSQAVFYTYIASGSNVNYAWDFGDAATAQSGVASHAYQSIGTFQVTARVWNGVSDFTKTFTIQVLGYQSFLGLISR